MTGTLIFLYLLALLLGICSTTTTTEPYTSTPPRTTTRPTTVPRDGCLYEGKYYANGENVERDTMYNCYNMTCEYGGIVAYDHKCMFYTPVCYGESKKVLGQCCPVCLNNKTTTPPTTTPSGGCVYNGKRYKNGEDIYRDYYNCGGTLCQGGQLLAWDDKCAFMTPPCNGNSTRVKGQCCPLCSNVTTTPPSTTPQIPGCLVDGRLYPHGQQIQIDPNNCSGSVCSYGVVNSWQRQCSYNPHLCKGGWKRVPDQCCLVCVNATTPAPETTTSPVVMCQIRNRNYYVGQRTNSDPCNVCRCTANGTESCLETTCTDVLDCEVKYKPFGACCYTCGSSRVITSMYAMLLLLFISEEFQPV